MGKALFSSNSDEWKTPQELYKELNERFKFTLDPCSTEENHLCDKYYTKKKRKRSLQIMEGGDSVC